MNKQNYYFASQAIYDATMQLMRARVQMWGGTRE